MFIYQCYYYTIFYGYIWLFVFNSWLFRDRFLENDKCNLLGPKDSNLHQTNNPSYNMDIKEDPPSSSAVEMVWWWARGASATLICPDVILMQDWGWPRARGRGEKSNVSYRIKFSLGFLAALRPPARRYTPGSVSAVSITQECRDAESPACCHSDRAAWIQSVTERVNARKREREKERDGQSKTSQHLSQLKGSWNHGETTAEPVRTTTAFSSWNQTLEMPID